MQRFLKKLLTRTLMLLLAGAIGLQIYTSWPSSATAEPLALPDDTRYLILVLHGTGGRDEPTLLEVTANIRKLIADEPAAEVRHYIWSPWSDGALRAGVNGRRIGHALGEELALLKNLKHIRLIATSAGSYLLEPLCETYKQDSAGARVEMTYLDSMGIRGGWDYWYGYRHYGKCADYAASIYNSDDSVPGTNAPLKHAYNIDVTRAPSRSPYTGNGHLWPVQWFLDHLDANAMTPGLRTHTEYQRGVVSSVAATP